MGNLYHDAGTVSSLVAGLCSAMLHVFQNLQSVVHQFVTLSAVDVHNHTYATSIVFVLALIKSFL